MGKKYVVWQGYSPGIYDSWEECSQQIKGYPQALYKSFKTLSEAEVAFSSSPSDYLGNQRKIQPTTLNASSKPDLNTISVDAACSGNPGVLEYQGVVTKTGQRLFHNKVPLGTNNIGEFLAIVHGLAYQKQHRTKYPIYTDSKIAMSWVKKKKCQTKLVLNSHASKEVSDLIHRAEKFLMENEVQVPILKWKTSEWGEIPADFGRK